MCTVPNYSTQFHSHFAQCQKPFYQDEMLLCERRSTGWHRNCLLPPLTTYQRGPGNAPCAPPPRAHILLLSTISASPRQSLVQTETRTQHRCDEEIARRIGGGRKSLNLFCTPVDPVIHGRPPTGSPVRDRTSLDSSGSLPRIEMLCC